MYLIHRSSLRSVFKPEASSLSVFTSVAVDVISLLIESTLEDTGVNLWSILK